MELDIREKPQRGDEDGHWGSESRPGPETRDTGGLSGRGVASVENAPNSGAFSRAHYMPA